MRGRILGRFTWRIACLILFTSSLLAADLPDLQPISLQIPSLLAAPPNPTVTITWGVTNQGAATPLGSYPAWFDALYIASNGVPDSQRVFAAPLPVYGPIQAETAYWATNSFQLPITQSGNYSLILKADFSNFLIESDETNNSLAVDFDYQATPSDLAPLALILPTVVTGPPNPSVTVVWAVTNQGTGTAFGSWVDGLYVSTNAIFDPQDVQVNSTFEQGPLAVGATYWRTNLLRLPITQSGTYYVAFLTDQFNWLFESFTNNNQILVPVEFHILPPDLAPIAVEAPRTLTVPPNPIVQIDWGVTNQGPGAAIGFYNWNDAFYLSTSSTLDPSASFLFAWSEAGPVDAGGVYWRTNQVRLPVVQSGTYYLIFSANQMGQLFEPNTNDNTLAVPISFTIQPPDLAPIAVEVPKTLTVPPNPIVQIDWGVTNRGPGAAIGFYNWNDTFYLSTNSTLDPSASFLFGWSEAGPVEPGGVYWRTNQVQLPVVKSGTYYLILLANQFSQLFELNTNDNTLAVPIRFNIQPPDLVPDVSLIPTNMTVPPNAFVDLIWGVTNKGIGAALGSWSDAVYFSTNTTVEWWSDPYSSAYANGPLPPGTTLWHTNSLQIPLTQSGTSFLIFSADANSLLYESDESNNVAVVPVNFTIQPADLAPIVLQVPTVVTATPNPSITISWAVTNLGPGSLLRIPGWSDALYFSRNGLLDGSQMQLWSQNTNGPLNAHNAYQLTLNLPVPVTQSGTYYLVFETDSFNWLMESNETNNRLVVPISFNILQPDLVPKIVQSPTQITGPPNPAFDVTVCVTNQGIGRAEGLWFDALYFSSDGTLDSADPLLAQVYQYTPLAVGAGYCFSSSVRVPVVKSGTYFLIFQTDPFNWVFESNTNNNIVSTPVSFTVQPPDLAPLAFVMPNAITNPPNPTLTFTWAITNQGIGSAVPSGSWADRIFVSTNTTFDDSATFVGEWQQTTSLSPGSIYWQTNSFRVPVVQSGNYYLFLFTDSYNGIYESDESNNLAVSSVTFFIQPPDLKPIGLQLPSTLAGPPNPTLTFAWGVTNQGIGMAIPDIPWKDSLYLSSTNVFDYNAYLVSASSVWNAVSPGESYWMTNSVNLPVRQSGTYYLFLKTDSDNSLFELDESNNQIIIPIIVTILPPDLVPIELQVLSSTDGPANPRILLAWEVKNQGTGAAIGSWTDQITLSKDPNPDYFDKSVFSYYQYGPLEPGGSYWQTNSVRVPVIESGTNYLVLQVNSAATLFEPVQTNNVLAVPVVFNVHLPDLSPVMLSAPNQIAGPPYPKVTISWGITNQGTGPAIGWEQWSDQLYLSTNAILDANANPISSLSIPETGPISAGHTYWRTRTASLPLTASGKYYLFLQADGQNSLPESNESNNAISTVMSFSMNPPDLAPIAFGAPTNLITQADPIVTLFWGVTNQGSGSAQNPFSSWIDQVYVSADDQLDSSDTLVSTAYESGPVAPGAAYWRTNTVRLPFTQDGTYYLLFKTDAGDALPESQESNNITAVRLTYKFGLADLAPLFFQAPSLVTGSANPIVTVSWGVTNQGNGTAQSMQGWQDSIYLSTDPLLGSPGFPIISVYHITALDAGATYWVTNSVLLPTSATGDWYLFLKVNNYGYVTESEVTNNTKIVPIHLNLTSPDLPDLAPISLQVAAVREGLNNALLTVSWGVTNQGSGAAVANGFSWSDYLWVYPTSYVTGVSTYLGNWNESDSIPPGGSYWRTNTVRVPLTESGVYNLIFQTDSGNSLGESTITNNSFVVQVALQQKSPDLVPIALISPLELVSSPYALIQVVWGVTNQGAGFAIPGPYWSQWNDILRLSTNATMDSLAQQVWFWPETNAIAPGQAYWRTNLLQLSLAQSGHYFLTLQANASGLGESIQNNNFLTVPLDFTVRFPDLAVLSWQAPTQMVNQPWPILTFIAGITNQGQGAALGSRTWYDSLYLSQTPFLDPQARSLGWWTRSNTVLPAGVYWMTNQVRIPVVDSSDYYLFFVTDDYNSLGEQTLSNNVVMWPLSLDLAPPADLTVTVLQAPPFVIGTSTPTISLVSHVLNQGWGPAIGQWSDSVSLSANGISGYPGLTRNVLTNQESMTLLPGQGYWRTNTIQMPEMQSGRYQLTFWTDVSASLYETDRDNNTSVATVDFNLTPPGPPSFGAGIMQSNGQFVVSVYGSFGSSLLFQVSTDLQDWQTLYSFYCTATPTYLTDWQAGASGSRFYRIVAP